MKQALNLSVLEAEEELKKSSQEFELAVDHLKNKVETTADTLERYSEAIQKPYVMIAMVATIGIFLGQLIKLSTQRSAQRGE